MEERKPKFKIGDRVKVMSLEEIEQLSYRCIMNVDLKEHLGKEYKVTGIRITEGEFYYFLNERDNTNVIESILTIVEEEKTYLQLDRIEVRGHIQTEMIDVDKVIKPSIESWKFMYSRLTDFINSASPQTKGFIAGQLYSLAEELMDEMTKEK